MGRVMLVDARKQFEKEPKAFASKRNRMTDAHRPWIEERTVPCAPSLTGRRKQHQK